LRWPGVRGLAAPRRRHHRGKIRSVPQHVTAFPHSAVMRDKDAVLQDLHRTEELADRFLRLVAGGGFTGEKAIEISKAFDTNFLTGH
jgi:hypothetical protein